jgi:hypothetical protein
MSFVAVRPLQFERIKKLESHDGVRCQTRPECNHRGGQSPDSSRWQRSRNHSWQSRRRMTRAIQSRCKRCTNLSAENRQRFAQRVGTCIRKSVDEHPRSTGFRPNDALSSACRQHDCCTPGEPVSMKLPNVRLRGIRPPLHQLDVRAARARCNRSQLFRPIDLPTRDHARARAVSRRVHEGNFTQQLRSFP